MKDTLIKRFLAVFFVLLISGSLTYLSTIWAAGWRVDLTDHHLYSLSQSTKDILQGLESPVKLQLYYSRTAARKSQLQMRQFNNYASYIEDLLFEYQRVAPAMVTFEMLDPRPDSDEERDAHRHELKVAPLTKEEVFVFGLVVQTETGVVKTISMFSPDREQFVEYDITKVIVSAMQTEKPVLGILSSLPVVQGEITPIMRQMMQMQGKQPPEEWYLATVLRENYDLRNIVAPEDLEGLDLLLVIHPKDLDSAILYAVDQYVVRGGNLMVFVDTYCTSDSPPPDPQSNQMSEYLYDHSSNLNSLTESWGVRILTERYAADMALARIVNTGNGLTNVRHLALLDLNKDCVNPESIITGKFNDMRLVLPGILKANLTDGITGMPILTTTETGGSFFCNNFELSNPETLQEKFTPQNEKIILGYRFSGQFASNFDKAPEDTNENVDEDGNPIIANPPINLKPHLQQGESSSTIVMFSDVDFISNNFAFRRDFFTGIVNANQNINILLNAVELLSGSTNLIEIRSRGGFRRSFQRVDKLEEQAEKKNEERNKEIQKRIDDFNTELNDLQEEAKQGGDQTQLKNDYLKKKKQIDREILQLEDQQRLLRQEKRKSIEQLGTTMKLLNLLGIPFLISIYCLWLTISRRIVLRARWEASHEN